MPDKQGVPTDLVTLKDAAHIARISLSTLKRWIAAGRVAVYGQDTAQRVSVRDVVPRGASRRKSIYYTPGDTPPILSYAARKRGPKPPEGV